METNNFNQQTSINQTNSGLGIAGLVIGIISLLLACCAVGGITGFIGLILSIIALTQKNKKHGMAIAGIILNAIAIILFLLFMFVIALGDKTNTNANTSSVENTINTEYVETELSTTQETIPSETLEAEKEQEAIETKDEFIAKCEEIPYKTLARNPEEYIGTYIVLDVKVTQILQGGFFDDNQYYRVLTNDEYDLWFGDEYFMYDSRVDSDMKLLENDIIKVYAKFLGTETVTRALTNTQEEIPAFEAVYIELISE